MAIVLTSIKHYLTFFWQCSCIDLVFRKWHFWELATELQKHVLTKISSKKISYNIYDIYIIGIYLRNDVRLMFRERDREKRAGREIERKKQGKDNHSSHFLIIIFFLVFYVNVQPSCSKTGMEYFNIKIRLFMLCTKDRFRM